MQEKRSCVLAINGGSSSLKFGLYHYDTGEANLTGSMERIGTSEARFRIKDANGHLLEDRKGVYDDVTTALEDLIKWLADRSDLYAVAAIGHRLVQGGPDHRAPEIIDEKLISSLEQLIHLAPNHLPASLALIRTCRKSYTRVPQIACFDTFFHRDMPPYALHFPIPRTLWQEGIIRYGFHGLSYEYIMRELGTCDPGSKKEKIIIAHLGNGCSMTAVQSGTGIDTTMGLTPTGGLVMGTRSGDLDPGLIFYLLRQKGRTIDEVEEIIDKKSGLEGLTGGGHDVQTLLEKEPTDPAAAEAITLFCYQAKKFIGALAAALGGLDTLVFTGGIGANSSVIRQRMVDGLQFMGIRIDEKNNTGQGTIISPSESRVTVYAIKTNEEMMISSHTRELVTSQDLKKK